MPYLRQAIGATNSELLFPQASGKRMGEDTDLPRVLRRALADADIVLGYKLICRRKGCGFREDSEHAEDKRCRECNFRLWPSAIVRPIRFYDLRHTTASLLMMAGTNPAAVQKILRLPAPPQVAPKTKRAVFVATATKMPSVSEASEYGRRGFRTPDPLRVNPFREGDDTVADVSKPLQTLEFGDLGDSNSLQDLARFSSDLTTRSLPNFSDAYLTVREAAALLKVSTATIYRMCHEGKLAHVRVSNSIRIPAIVVGRRD